jgi:hypothetical protein
MSTATARKILVSIDGSEHALTVDEARAVARHLRHAVNVEVRQRREEEREAAGLCHRCHLRPIAASSRSRCTECLEYAIAWAKKNRGRDEPSA